MAKHNGANARIKREYFFYLKEAKRRDEASIDAAAKAIADFEVSNGHKDFKYFHRKQAMAFKRKLNEKTNARTGKPLSRATVNSSLSALSAFFIGWQASPVTNRAFNMPMPNFSICLKRKCGLPRQRARRFSRHWNKCIM